MSGPASIPPLPRLAAATRLLAGAGAGASVLGLSALPFAPSLPAAAVTTLLALPCCLLGRLVVWAAVRPSFALTEQPGLRRWVVVIVVAGLVFAVGAYLSNVTLVDDPLQFATLVGYGVSGVVAVLVAGTVSWGLERGRLGDRIDRVPLEQALAALTLAAAVGLVVLDATFLTEGYAGFHVLLLVLAVLASSSFAALVARSRAARRVTHSATSIIIGASALLVSVGRIELTLEQLSGSATLGRRLLLLARSALDHDRDGFSSALAGGDCDDRDRGAFPLSLRGRDCLGWIGNRPPVADWHAPPALKVAGSAPRVILLITVDALRCDSEAAIFDGLPRLCPALERLAREGIERKDAHTSYPSTAHATLSLHRGIAYPRADQHGTMLAEWMATDGRKTHAVSTHSKQMPQVIARTFQTVDRELQPVTLNGSASTSARVSDRTLNWLKGNNSQPAFLWTHYYDPHSPYVAAAGSRSALTPATKRYAAEVRRTDAEVDRLIREAARLEPNLLVLLTADHGEEFAEHGNLYHGTTLYEAAVRIPMLAWSPDAALLERLGDLPASIAEVPRFLVSAARAERFISSNEAFFWVASQGKRWVGLYRDGYKVTYDEGLNVAALYDVSQDPGEKRNLAHSQRALFQQLGARLAAYLQPPLPAVRPDESDE